MGKSGERKTYCWWRRIRLGSDLSKLYILKSLGPNGMYPKVLREVVNAILRLFSIIYGRS